jgi:hypothetical protein
MLRFLNVVVRLLYWCVWVVGAVAFSLGLYSYIAAKYFGAHDSAYWAANVYTIIGFMLIVSGCVFYGAVRLVRWLAKLSRTTRNVSAT